MTECKEPMGNNEESLSRTGSGTPDHSEISDYREIIFEQQGPIAVLTLNRPDIRNAFTHQEMIDEIVDVCQKVQDSDLLSVSCGHGRWNIVFGWRERQGYV